MRSCQLVVAAAGAALLLAACGIPAAGPGMEPGADCMSCHSGGIAPAWTASGTLFTDPASAADGGLEGAQVIITDNGGRELTLTTNSAGNFYTAESLAFPIHVQAQFGAHRMAMSSTSQSGSCNSCHAAPGLLGAPGRLFVAP